MAAGSDFTNSVFRSCASTLTTTPADNTMPSDDTTWPAIIRSPCASVTAAVGRPTWAMSILASRDPARSSSTTREENCPEADWRAEMTKIWPLRSAARILGVPSAGLGLRSRIWFAADAERVQTQVNNSVHVKILFIIGSILGTHTPLSIIARPYQRPPTERIHYRQHQASNRTGVSLSSPGRRISRESVPAGPAQRTRPSRHPRCRRSFIHTRVLNLREPEVCRAPERSTFPSRAGASGSHHLPWAESGGTCPLSVFSLWL